MTENTTSKPELKAGMNPGRLVSAGVFLFALMTIIAAPDGSYAKQSIVALVNDEPISAFDLNQRIKLFLSNSQQLRKKMKTRLRSPNINTQFRKFAMRHNPKSRDEVQRLQKKFVSSIRREIIKSLRPQARKLAMDELIEERIKLQEAKRLNIVVSEAQISGAIANLAKQNKMNQKQFASMLRGMGINIATMKQRMKAGMSWQRAVQRKYRRELSLANTYLNRELSTVNAGSGTQNNIELQLHRITLPLSGKINQQIMVERFAEADRLRGRFKSCKTMRDLTQNVDKAKFENLGRKSASTFSEPTRSQLIQAKIGEMPPPSLSPQGIQLYAVCGRRILTATKKKRVAEKKKLQMQEFNILAERHLRDLKQDAFIEYR